MNISTGPRSIEGDMVSKSGQEKKLARFLGLVMIHMAFALLETGWDKVKYQFWDLDLYGFGRIYRVVMRQVHGCFWDDSLVH